MAITITNTLALIATHQLNKNQSALNLSLQRLSTGFRINSGKDDPAGLIASELLRAEKASTAAAIANAQRADSVLATAEGGLNEASALLVSLQGLITASANTAGLGPDELDANQLQVDSILSSISRIARATTFAGRPLLDGQFSYRLSAGANFTALHNVNIHSAQVPANGTTINVEVVASAQHATLVYQGNGNGLGGPTTLSLAGANGTVQLSFASSTSVATIATAINELTNSTGITASANATDLAFFSTGYGATQFVSVLSNSTTFQTQTLGGLDGVRAVGRDATVTLNGQTFQSNGLALAAHSNNFDASFSLDPTLNTAGATAQFAITGGGATFALTDNFAASDSDSLSLPNLNTGALGYYQPSITSYALADLTSTGKLNLRSGKLDVAQQVISNAIKDVARSRGQIGAFRAYNIDSEINALNVKLENLSSAESQIRDTDFAEETANLTRGQILLASSQSVLSAALKNQRIILKLLGAE